MTRGIRIDGRSCIRGVILGLLFLGLSGPAIGQQPAYLLFGGQNHDVFLGCLNCNRFDQASLCNGFGRFGNPFSGESIWNRYTRFGNPFSADSPWNGFAAEPPVVVDRQGRFYGYFTANQFHVQRVRSSFWLRVIGLASSNGAEGHEEARKMLCGS